MSDAAREALTVLLGPAPGSRPAEGVEALLLEGRGADARPSLDAALAKDPGEPRASLLSALARLTDGDPQGARQDLGRARKDGALAPALAAVEALARAQGGDAAGALCVLDGAIAGSSAGWLRALRGTVRLSCGDLTGARADLDAAAKEEASAWVLAQRADALNRLGFYRDALKDLAVVQALAPGNAAPLLLEANVWFDQAFYTEAMAAMDKAAALAPADPALRQRRARFLTVLGRLDEAAADLVIARRGAPEDAQLRYEALLVDVLRGKGPAVAKELKKRPLEAPYAAVLTGFLETRAGRRAKGAAAFLKAAKQSGGAFAERMRLYASVCGVLGERKGPRSRAGGVDFYMCGIGIKHPFQATVEILRALDRCAVIYNNLGDPQIADFLGLFDAEVKAVDRRPGEPAMGRVERILAGVRKRRLPTGFVTRIHPFIYRRIANDLAQHCEDMGLSYRAFASVSLTEAAWGLGEQAGGPPPQGAPLGGRVFDLVWLVAHPECLEPRLATVVYCIASAEARVRFAELAASRYPAGHRGYVLAGSGDKEQEVREVAVAALPRELPGFDMGAVLYLPPAGERS